MATKALLHFNGTNGSTTFTDAVGLYSWSANGTAQLGTAQQKFGSASLNITNSNAYAFATFTGAFPGSAWTFEGFVRFPSVTGNHGIWAIQGASAPLNLTYAYNQGNGTGNKYGLSYTGAAVGPTVVGTKTAWAVDTWYHWAATYDSVAGNYYFYIDGVLDGTIASATLMSGSNRIAAIGFDGVSGATTQGWQDEVRFSDTCLYPSGTTFTVPSAEFDIPVSITPSVGALSLAGVPPSVTQTTNIVPGTGALSLTGQLANASNSGQRNIAPPTGSLSLVGQAADIQNFRAGVTGALTLAGVSPVLTVGVSIIPGTGALTFTSYAPPRIPTGAGRLRALSAVGSASGGAYGAAEMRPLSSTGEAADRPFATGAATLRKLTAVGYLGAAGNPVLQPVSATGQARGSVIGAATLRAIKSNQITGFPRLRKLAVAGYASSSVAVTYRAHVMNTATNAVTEYTGHRFNSFAQIGSDYYGAGPDGLVKLDGDNDAGSNIDWQVRTGQVDDKQIGLKRIPEVVMGLRASGPVRVRVYPDDNQYFDYMLPNVKVNTIRQYRVTPGKGMRARYFAVELQGVANSAIELDSLQMNMTPTTRRIG